MKPVNIQSATPAISPADLVRLRFEALLRGDFGFIYDSTHPQAPFRQLFPQRRDYVRFGVEHLPREQCPHLCRVVDERRPEEGVAELILVFRFGRAGEEHWLFELARLLRTDAGWRYHSGHKMTREDFSGPVEELGFADFAHLEQPISF